MRYLILSLTCFFFFVANISAQNEATTPKNKLRERPVFEPTMKVKKQKSRDPRQVSRQKQKLEKLKTETATMANHDGQISAEEAKLIEAYERRIEELENPPK